MKKKVIGILVCIMLMAVIPTAAGLNCDTQAKEAKILSDDNPDSETEGLLKDRIILRGIVFNPHTTFGGKFAFFGVRVHYTAIGLEGVRTGSILLKRVTLPADPNGFIGNTYICVTLRARLDDIV